MATATARVKTLADNGAPSVRHRRYESASCAGAVRNAERAATGAGDMRAPAARRAAARAGRRAHSRRARRREGRDAGAREEARGAVEVGAGSAKRDKVGL